MSPVRGVEREGLGESLVSEMSTQESWGRGGGGVSCQSEGSKK